MGPSYWPRLMFLEQTGPHGRQLWRPFWPTFHWERAPRMCLELTGSLWRFQKWCEKVESDQKWPNYRDLKITHFHKSRVAVERWWPKQGSDDDPRTLLPPLPLGFVKVVNFQISVTRPFLVRFDFFTAFLEISKRALSFWKHSRPHFTMTNGPKRPQKLAAAPSVAVPLYNSETTFFWLNGHCYCIVLNLSVVGVNRKVSKRLKHDNINVRDFITFNILSGWPCRFRFVANSFPQSSHLVFIFSWNEDMCSFWKNSASQFCTTLSFIY